MVVTNFRLAFTRRRRCIRRINKDFQKLFLDWSKGGRRKFIYVVFLEEKNRQIRERDQTIYTVFRHKQNTPNSPIPARKCITWLCFHIEIDWDDLAWDGGFMQNQIYYCICVYYFRWRQKSSKSKSSISILHLENHFEANFLLIIMLSIH